MQPGDPGTRKSRPRESREYYRPAETLPRTPKISNCPTALIFVPSRDGISHNVKEYTAPDQIEAGANVLLQVLLAAAE